MNIPDLPETAEELLVWTIENSNRTLKCNFQTYLYKEFVRSTFPYKKSHLPRSLVVKHVTEWVYRVCKFAPEAVKLKEVGASYDLLSINGIAIRRVMHDTEQYRTIIKLLNK